MASRPAEAGTDDRHWRTILALLCAQVFLIHVGQQLVVPILPLYASTFGISTVAIGTMLTIQSVPRLFISVPAGHLADRYGAHRVLFVACLFAVASGATGALANGYGLLLTSRIIQGVASALSATAGLTYAATLGDAARSGRRISLYQGSHLLGNSFGPVAGGFVAEALGYRAPFAIFAVLAALTAFGLARRLPHPRSVRDPSRTDEPSIGVEVAPPGRLERKQMLTLLATGGVAISCFIGLIAAYTRSGTRNFALVLLADMRGIGESRIGLLLSGIFLANVVVLYLVGVLVDRYGARIVFVPGWLVMASGLYLMTRPSGFSVLLVGALIYGLGSGIGNSVPAMHVSSVVAPDQRGLALGLYRTFGDLGLIIGPLLMGWLIVTVGVTTGITINAVAVAVAAVAFWVFGPVKERAR